MARKPDEIALFNELRSRSEDGRGYIGGRSGMIALCEELGIPEKRAFYILIKWSENGWWDYGMWAWGGWFTPEAPSALTS